MEAKKKLKDSELRCFMVSCIWRKVIDCSRDHGRGEDSYLLRSNITLKYGQEQSETRK